MKNAIETYHLQLGTEGDPLQNSIQEKFTDSVWLQQLTTVIFKITIYRENVLKFHKQRENDTTIMGKMIKVNLTILELKQINTWRMHVKAIFLSNIVDIEGKTIMNEYFFCKVHDSNLTWPNIPHPPLPS